MRSDILDWLSLSRIPGIGSLRFQYLIEQFKDPKDIFRASTHELTEVKGIDKRTAQNILENHDKAREQSSGDLQFLMDNKIDLVTFKDQDYPANLKNIHSFPPLLYVKGKLHEQDKLAVGIVGSRKATTYGILVAKKLAEDLASRGITVISGMARGVDSASHRGALEMNGRTIAVLGNGIDICYPSENKDLMEKISTNGAVVSEFPLKTPPQAENFPIRNRIISGLSLGVIIVEANEKSGALITADYALQQGREVFAVPGNVTAETSRGTNRLIKQGAKLVVAVEDILEEILPGVEMKKTVEPIVLPKTVESNLSDPERKIMSVLSGEPMHVDMIAQNTGFTTIELPQHLLNLELLGHITQLSGKRYVKSL